MLKDLIGEYGISGCCVRDKTSFALVCQNWEVDDPLEPHETRIITYELKEDEEVWHSHDVGPTTGLHCCPVLSPAIGWLFVTDMSEVCFCSDGELKWEEKVSDDAKVFTFNVNCINDGYAYSVGPKCSVYKRESENSWVKMESGMRVPESSRGMSFVDIDGFSDDDIYAGGGKAGLWNYQQASWKEISLPTNLKIKYICCGEDGYTYLVTPAKTHLICGRDDEWFEIEKSENTKEFLGKITWFNDKLLLLTTKTIYQVDKTGFDAFDTSASGLAKFSHIASTNEMLMLTGFNEVSLFDGVTWRHLK
jgi:hypothetical protein